MADAFYNLGQSLGRAAEALAGIEQLEAQERANQQDIQNVNRMYMDYFNEVENLKSQYGDRLTSTAIRRRAYKNTIDKWQSSGIPITQLQNMINQENAFAGFSTEADKYIARAQEVGLTLTQDDLADPQKFMKYKSMLDRLDEVKYLEAQDNISDREAMLYYENHINAYSAGLATQLNSVNRIVNQATMGGVDINKAIKQVNSFFDSFEMKLNNVITSLDEKGKQAFGKKALDQKLFLNDLRTGYVNNLVQLQKAQSQLAKAKTEEEVAKANALLEYINNNTKLTQAIIDNQVMNTEEGRKAYALASIIKTSGVQASPQMQDDLYDLSAAASKQVDIDSINRGIKTLRKENHNFNTVADIVSKNDKSESSVNAVVTSLANILADYSDTYQIISSPEYNQQEKIKAYTDYVKILGALGVDDLFLNSSKYIEEAASKYPDNEDLQVIYNFTQRLKANEAQVEYYKLLENQGLIRFSNMSTEEVGENGEGSSQRLDIDENKTPETGANFLNSSGTQSNVNYNYETYWRSR